MRHPDPFIEIEAAVVGPVGDKHHLMAATVGEDKEIARLGRALQGDLLLGGGQAVDIILEGEGVREHMALHCWLISNTPLKVVAGKDARGARLALLDQIAVMRTCVASVGLFC